MRNVKWVDEPLFKATGIDPPRFCHELNLNLNVLNLMRTRGQMPNGPTDHD
jgi:hypothetical protein